MKQIYSRSEKDILEESKQPCNDKIEHPIKKE